MKNVDARAQEEERIALIMLSNIISQRVPSHMRVDANVQGSRSHFVWHNVVSYSVVLS